MLNASKACLVSNLTLDNPSLSGSSGRVREKLLMFLRHIFRPCFLRVLGALGYTAPEWFMIHPFLTGADLDEGPLKSRVALESQRFTNSSGTTGHSTNCAETRFVSYLSIRNLEFQDK